MSQYNSKKSDKPIDDYKKIDLSIENNQVGNLYILFGDEHYLRDRSIEKLRKFICPDGTESFNYKRFEGNELTPGALENAIDTLPVFAERTMIEIHDFDIFSKDLISESSYIKDSEVPLIVRILSNLPEYICILFIYNTIIYKPDKRLKVYKDISKNATEVEFAVQNSNDLIKWITNHYKHQNKSISKQDAEYLINITGGLMTTLKNEIEKTVSHSKTDYITRADIDAVVIPVLDAYVYELAEAIIKRNFIKAVDILDELLLMREAPHKLLYNISLKMRQLLAARICVETKSDKYFLMDISGISYDFQAQKLIDTARKTTLSNCSQAVINCAAAAYDLNSAPNPEARLIELVAELAAI